MSAPETGKPDLIAVSPAQLHVGAALRFTLRDEQGRVLLARGLRIDNVQALESLQKRKAVYVEYEESDEALKVLMSGLTEARRRDAPIKDIDKLASLKAPETEPAFQGTPQQAWAEVEARLKALLTNLHLGGDAATESVARLTLQVDQWQQNLLERDREAALFLLMHRAVTGYAGYSALHALLCAVVCHLLSAPLKLSAQESAVLVRAALTMNAAMTGLQDVLAGQKQRPTPSQQGQIDHHPEESARLLWAAGVTDLVWLDTVRLHHATLPPDTLLADRPPAQRLAKILQTVDRYTAAMSPRVSRAGRDAKDAARSAIVQAGRAGHDEVGLGLIQVMGLHPAGTFIKLASGETAVVLRRGSKPNEPFVASVLNRRDEPIAEPRLLNTARADHAVQHGVPASAVRVRLNSELMLRQLAFSKTGSDRATGLL